MRGLAVLGNLSRDVVDGSAPRVGGAPFHAARALRLLGGRSRVVARCAPADRRSLLPPLVALGVPVHWLPSEHTTSFELGYHGDVRAMTVGELAGPWSLAETAAASRAGWLQLGALTQEDFPAPLVAALARERRIALDGQGLVRRAAPGPLRLTDDFDRDVLRSLTVLKLAEDEAEALGGEDAAAALRVPELLVTYGSRGAVLIADGLRESVPARRLPSDVDPTGAGDAFLATYVWARATGHRPRSALRQATLTAARVLELGQS